MVSRQAAELGNHWNRLQYYFALWGCFWSFLLPSAVQGQDDASALSTEEIAVLFADVLDKAVVIDAVGVQAETLWFASGHFETRWWSSNREGWVTGRWMARDSKRCVLISEPSPASAPGWRCGKILREFGGVYRSLNPDDSTHGLHQLSALPAELKSSLP
ncbi:hypothetical protein ACMAY6_09810 [Luminiphilus sp. nBUS_16]|uniref:hypothetical protein n=1 Tax=Luminiphilus sp. nBUS_16 TaxID=3395315 RepID=UPI003EBE13F1